MNASALESTTGLRQLKRISFRSLPQAAAQQVREGILSGRILPGERLVEQKLASELGIGQPTVREALKELEHEGFVCKIPNKGTYVTRLEDQDLNMILEVRLTVEALAIRRAMRNMTKSDVRELQGIVEAMDSAARSLDFASFYTSDVAFHRKIWDLSGNRYVGTALEPLTIRLFAFGLIPPPGQSDPRKPLADVQTHREILEGLCSGDPERACQIFVDAVSKNWAQIHRVEIDRSVIPTIPSESRKRMHGRKRTTVGATRAI